MRLKIYYLLQICLLIIYTIIVTIIPVQANGADVGELLNFSIGAITDKSVIRLDVNGRMSGVAEGARVVNDQVMVPLKWVAEALEIPVIWFESTQILRVDDIYGTSLLKMGDTKAEFNGAEIKLVAAPQIDNGRFLVPLNYLVEVLQAQVQWFPDQTLIKINRSTLEGVTYEVYPDKVRIIFKQTVPENHNIFTLRQPQRLVIDFSGSTYVQKKTEEHINSNLVTGLRISQFQVNPPVARAVLDLAQPDYEYKVQVLTAQHKLIIDVFHRSTNQAGSTQNQFLSVQDQILRNKIIVIDPGHGAKNSGAIGVTGTWESEINYDIAVRVNELLQGVGAYTIMTRKAGEDPGLYDRAAISNNNRADIFISIHADAHPKAETRGSTVYAHPSASKETWALAWYIHNEMLKTTGILSKGLRAANFVVVREPKAPAILVETAYLTNREDEALLKDPEFRQKAALGIFNGIVRYFEKK